MSERNSKHSAGVAMDRAAREERLAEALKANLRRRKAQARSRAQVQTEDQANDKNNQAFSVHTPSSKT